MRPVGKKWTRLPAGVLWVAAVMGMSGAAIGSPGIDGVPDGVETSRPLPLYFPAAQNDDSSWLKIRALALDVREKSTRALLELTRKRTTVEHSKTRLELVRALSAHEQHSATQDPLRTEVVRALIVLFEVQVDASRGKKNESNGPLRHLSRGTAAMALAITEHPEALRKLVAVALNGVHGDPTGAELARAALRAVPTQALNAQTLAPLFSPTDVKEALKHPRDEGTPAKAPPPSPELLVALGKSWETATTTTGASDYQHALHALLQEQALPRAYREVKSWAAAHKNSPKWTMRSAALLSGRLPRSVLKRAIEHARTSLNSSEEAEVSAAAWLLAVVDPYSTRSLLKKTEPKVTFAILRQASEGVVAEFVAETLLGIPANSGLQKEERMEDVARKMILLEPNTWHRISTAQLRRWQADHDGGEWHAALASRVRKDGRGLAPQISTVRHWLNDENSELRSGVAWGLGESPSSHVAALLFSAYREETDPVVRRALVSSLNKKNLSALPLVRNLIALDPDDGCRAIAKGEVDPGATGVYLTLSHRKLEKVEDRQGRLLHVVPDGDGFVGIVRSTL